jgi:5,10-methylenetetrahydrofolate reductase
MAFKLKLESGERVVTVEMSPPKGNDVSRVMEVADSIRGKVHAINVTDNQRAVMRMSPLALSTLLKAYGHEPVMQICCRDRNRIALQSDLLGAYAMGIRNLCVMTGDHPRLGDHPSAKAVFDLDSVQLLALIKQLGEGKDFMGNPLEGHVDFTAGAVFNPYAEPMELQVIKLKKKIDAGARFIQTQPVFDMETVEKVMKYESETGVRFLVGITPLRSVGMAKFLSEKLLNTPIPQEIMKRLEVSTDEVEEGLDIAAHFVNRIRDFVKGIHIMPIGGEAKLKEFLDLISF